MQNSARAPFREFIRDSSGDEGSTIESVSVSVSGSDIKVVGAPDPRRRLHLCLVAAGVAICVAAAVVATARAANYGRAKGILVSDKSTSDNATNVSLFCFMVVQPPPSYEYELAKYFYNNKYSIFGCEEWAVYSDKLEDPLPLGLNADQTKVATIPIPGPQAFWKRQWNTNVLQNGMVFFRAWDKVVTSGVYKRHNFTVKIDADAVFLPEVLKHHLAQKGQLNQPDVGAGKFFLNCKEFESMQGPLEVISRAAVHSMGIRRPDCIDNEQKHNMPEDKALDECLRHLGTRALPMYGALFDIKCGVYRSTYPPKRLCEEPGYTVYHYMKTIPKIEACYSKLESLNVSV